MTDLRKVSADYIVIYYAGFGAAPSRLAAWRNTPPAAEGVSAPYAHGHGADLGDHDQFLGRTRHPPRHPNFLRAVFLEQGRGAGDNRKPSFVMLLGRTPRRLQEPARQGGGRAARVPAAHTERIRRAGARRASVHDRRLAPQCGRRRREIIPDFFGGAPGRGPGDGDERGAEQGCCLRRQTPFGDYRNRVMLIADDNFQCADSDPDQAGASSCRPPRWTKSTPPPHIDPTTSTSTLPRTAPRSCTQPAAKAEIRRNLGRRGVMFNYIGNAARSSSPTSG